MLNAKIRDIYITGKDLNYEGSITLDPEYCHRAGIAENEAVDVLNLSNGARFTTYVIYGTPGKKEVLLNGPASRLGEYGDEVIVLSYIQVTEEDVADHRITMVRGEK
jgi:aspartate 1-decarboxylase